MTQRTEAEIRAEIERLDLDTLEAMECAATPGSWTYDSVEKYVADADGDMITDSMDPKDDAFIVALRNAAPALISAAKERDALNSKLSAADAEIADLRARLAKAEAALGTSAMDATTPELTPAQQRALDWLPADGSWRMKAGRLPASLASLGRQYQHTVEKKWGQFGPRGGWEIAWRLTPVGVALFHPAPDPVGEKP